jgi:hypothetical protein
MKQILYTLLDIDTCFYAARVLHSGANRPDALLGSPSPAARAWCERAVLDRLRPGDTPQTGILVIDVMYDILGLYNEGRIKLWLPSRQPLATDNGLPETPDYRAT